MSQFWSSYKQTLLLLGGIIIGGTIGFVWPGTAPYLKPVGDIFMNLLFVLIVPLVFFSVSNSVANLTRRNMLGKMLGCSFSVWVLMLVIAAVFTYFVTLIYNPIEVGADLMADGVELAAAQERSLGELIVNTVTQVTSSPNRIAVTINKDNYSHHIIKQTGVMNVNCLSVDAPFKVFETYGFVSGRNVDKFAGTEPLRSANGLVVLPRYINAILSLKVEEYMDLGTHGMFLCSLTEAHVISDAESMTYAYYQEHVKPKPQTEGKKGYVCKICGYVYEGDELPEDFVCPLCKHGAADFEPIQ